MYFKPKLESVLNGTYLKNSLTDYTKMMIDIIRDTNSAVCRKIYQTI